MPKKILELYPIENNKRVFNSFGILYKRKICSFLFVTIATKPDIAFAVFCYFKFNQQLRPQYHEIANQVFYYLFSTSDNYFCYKKEA